MEGKCEKNFLVFLFLFTLAVNFLIKIKYNEKYI